MSRLEFALAWTLGVLVFAHGVMLNRPFYRAVTFLPPPPAEARQLGDYLLMRVSETQGPVLSEDAVVNILARKDVPYHPFIMSQLVREGKWDPAPFLTMLRDEHFQLVVTEKNLETEYFYGFTEEMRDVLLERYELDEVIPFYPGSQRFVYALRNNP